MQLNNNNKRAHTLRFKKSSDKKAKTLLKTFKNTNKPTKKKKQKSKQTQPNEVPLEILQDEWGQARHPEV